MAIFGGLKKPSTFGQVPGMMQPEMAQPMMQPGMMQAPIQQPMEAKKPGPNWAGIAADFLAGMAGQPGQFAAQQQHERAMQQRQQMAEQERMTRREDMQWEWANKPKEQRVNDTEADWNYYKSVLTPTEFETWKQRKINPPQFISDGYGGGNWATPSVATGLPEIGAVVPRNKGGPVQQAPGNFRPR